MGIVLRLHFFRALEHIGQSDEMIKMSAKQNAKRTLRETATER